MHPFAYAQTKIHFERPLQTQAFKQKQSTEKKRNLFEITTQIINQAFTFSNVCETKLCILFDRLIYV